MFRKETNIIQRKTKAGITFLVRIRTEDGEVSKSFNPKNYPNERVAFETAVKYRNKMLYELSVGMVEKKNNSTVKDMFNYYLDHTTDLYKTKDYHIKLFNKYIKHKDTKIQELTKAMIVEDLNKMVEIASDDTIGRVYCIYRDDIVGSALLQDIVMRDVTLGIQRPKSHMIALKRGVTTDRETLLKVEDGIRKTVASNYDARIIVYLLETLYYTGMRPAEVEVLTRDDIKRDYISVTKELGSNMDENHVVRKCKTPNSIRNVPIHKNLKPILNDLMEYALYDELFVRENGEYMDSTWIGNIIRRICKTENISFNMYRLRHNMATSLVTKQVDTKTTMEILGHATYDMSLYYASSNDDLKEKAIELLS